MERFIFPVRGSFHWYQLSRGALAARCSVALQYLFPNGKPKGDSAMQWSIIDKRKFIMVETDRRCSCNYCCCCFRSESGSKVPRGRNYLRSRNRCSLNPCLNDWLMNRRKIGCDCSVTFRATGRELNKRKQLQ